MYKRSRSPSAWWENTNFPDSVFHCWWHILLPLWVAWGQTPWDSHISKENVSHPEHAYHWKSLESRDAGLRWEAGSISKEERSACHDSEVLRAWLSIQEAQEVRTGGDKVGRWKGGPTLEQDLGTMTAFMLLSTSQCCLLDSLVDSAST